MNHARPGVGNQHYNHAKMLAQVRDALDLWGSLCRSSVSRECAETACKLGRCRPGRAGTSSGGSRCRWQSAAVGWVSASVSLAFANCPVSWVASSSKDVCVRARDSCGAAKNGGISGDGPPLTSCTITSMALASTPAGTPMPSTFAVLRLMSSSTSSIARPVSYRARPLRVRPVQMSNICAKSLRVGPSCPGLLPPSEADRAIPMSVLRRSISERPRCASRQGWHNQIPLHATWFQTRRPATGQLHPSAR